MDTGKEGRGVWILAKRGGGYGYRGMMTRGKGVQ